MVSILYSLLPLSVLFNKIYCEQEHKVHNIVLYPEKHSWCQTTPIQQVVASSGYEPVTIQNNVCVGACFSYSIPKSEPAEPGELIGPYCDSCQPSEIKCYHVNLKAEESNVEGVKILQKRIEVIMNCSCQSCNKIRLEDCAINDTNTMELPLNMYVDQENFKTNEDNIHPDLFEAQNSHKTFENDIKLKNKLKKWFETYQSESGDHKNSELADLINIDKKNEKIVKDLEGLPKTFGVEGAASHQKGAHIGMGISHHPNDVVDPDTKTPDLEVQPPHHHHHSHHHHGQSGEETGKHHHYLGEEQHIGLDVTQLVRGPHGSMIATPTEVKLHIDSDSLKPNDEGLVVEYESHHQKDPLQKVADLMSID
ncbi:unnamed protein product [Ceutorhynchus assimilis]|uniref:DAN domain-containing protein n=1 Tax=Ceutorhynchus assimilis TaxID=467358 RepID=A0A9P0GMU8_9CUCU|nr:unnamed protein product [Ceutorhynchus assimilis]